MRNANTSKIPVRATFAVPCLGLAMLALLSISDASAEVLTLNFPDDLSPPPNACCNNSNAIAQGFRISPSVHYGTVIGPSAQQLPGIGWDSAGYANPDYLGASTGLGFGGKAALYVDHQRTKFSFLEGDFSISSNFETLEAVSSNGGLFVFPGTGSRFTQFSFSGPQWTDIKWLVFAYVSFDPGFPIDGFDQLVVQVGGS